MSRLRRKRLYFADILLMLGFVRETKLDFIRIGAAPVAPKPTQHTMRVR
jgi:hypothetical protein